MRISALCGVLIALLLTASVSAAPYTLSCSVSPNPSSAGQPLTATAESNRLPLYVDITQPGQNFASRFGPFDVSPATVQFQTAFSGTGSVRVFAVNEKSGHGLGSAYCNFTVLP